MQMYFKTLNQDAYLGHFDIVFFGWFYSVDCPIQNLSTFSLVLQLESVKNYVKGDSIN